MSAQASSHNQVLLTLFQQKRVLTLAEIQHTLNSNVHMTVYRHLKFLGYKTSYSHAGRYYTLEQLTHYDENGIWAVDGILFSKYGTLLKTVAHLIQTSQAGLFAAELKNILKLPVYNQLRQLVNANKIQREQVGGEFFYLSPMRSDQFKRRKKQQRVSTTLVENPAGKDGYTPEDIENLNLFLTCLNEKQIRLFLGFESLRIGYGGNKLMSEVTGIDVRTIAKGKEELLTRHITPDRIRREGGGRPSKKKPTS